MTKLQALHEQKQSTWLNYMRRAFIESGELRERMRDGIQAITANAAVFERALAACADYDTFIRQQVAAGMPARRIHEALMIDDVQRAADMLHPIFEQTEGLDGFASLEIDPATAQDATEAVATARHFAAAIDRGNIMVEIPATPQGIEAIQALIADGTSVNATHLFSVEAYERVAQAYIAGLESYFDTHSVWRIAPTAVASFSLSPIDDAVDERLLRLGRPELRSTTAIALAKVLYGRFQEIFSGPRWERLARRGARVLRPKWTRLMPHDFSTPDTLYVDALIGPDTVMTFSLATLNAFLDHGTVGSTLATGLEQVRAHLTLLESMDIDVAAIGAQLQQTYLVASDKQYQSLIQQVSEKREELESDWQRMTLQLGTSAGAAETALEKLNNNRVMCRIWQQDHTVWKPDPTEITNRLGWLHIMERMLPHLGRIDKFATDVRADGYTHAVLIGMGGSSLAPELFHKTFGKPAQPPMLPFRYLPLDVLDTTDADAVRAIEHRIDLAKTLFIVSTKSGGTVETLSGFKYFYNLMVAHVGAEAAGAHFAAITDPGSKLAKLADRFGFRQVFFNDPNIGGRYSALSFFGLVPAALVGVDLRRLLREAQGMAANAESCHTPLRYDNVAAHLGTIMGTLAQNGRNKATFITSHALRSFGDWVEQLIAESTGKEGQGIVPVVGEALLEPAAYADDRLFIHLRLAGDATNDTAVRALRDAGHPVITLHLKDLYELGGQFFLWEMTTAVAGHFLQINPFDQPNVESAKVRAREMVAAYAEQGALPEEKFAPLERQALDAFLAEARPGNYIALQAFVTPTPAAEELLQQLRTDLQQTTRLATTVGFGPRFLHSTGQLHKGDNGSGLFVQFVSAAEQDLPIPDDAGKPESSMGFDVLKHAQALGDAQALRDANRRLIRFDLGTDIISGLQKLTG